MNDNEHALADIDRERSLQKVCQLLAKVLYEEGWFRTCHNCSSWDETNEICRKFKERPPVKTIIVGCKFHSDIPF